MEHRNASIKGLIAAAVAATALSGCAVVPAEPVPVYAAPAPVYIAPAPAVVVRPYAYYGGHPGGRYWRRWH